MSFRKIIISFSVFAVLVLLGVGIFSWTKSRTGANLDITIQAPEQIPMGVPIELTVSISNRSRSVLGESRLSLNLPTGTVFVGAPVTKNIDYRELGAIGEGSITAGAFDIMM